MPRANRKPTTPDRSKIELARRIDNAIISYTMGVTYQTAEKKYCSDLDPHPSFVDACCQLYEAKVKGMPEALIESTEDELLAALRAFIDAVRNKRHWSRSFTNDPNLPGIFISLASCPDEMADQLKARMDEIVPAEFAEKGVRRVNVQ